MKNQNKVGQVVRHLLKQNAKSIKSEFPKGGSEVWVFGRTAQKVGCILALLTLVISGCSTNPHSPGPRAGVAIGQATGAVVGNVAGFGVGVVAGTVSGTASVFDPSYHEVRTWHTEVTTDGRTISVPGDTLCDAYGRPVR